MPWKIYADDKLVYDPRVSDRGYAVGNDATLAVELSRASRFSFRIPPTNPAYSSIVKGHTIVELIRGGRSYFRGRVMDDTADFRNWLSVVCESELSYLNDARQRPYTFPQEEGKTDVVDYLRFLIDRYNPQVEPYQRFVVGRVTVKDPNGYIHRSDTEYSTTWKLIKEGLLDKLGGFLMVRREGGVNYLDYLAEIDTVSGQSITFGRNLLDLETKRSKSKVFSVIIPLGAKNEETGERLTLADIPDEDTEDICKKGDALYSKAAVARYGRIEQVRTFDDITTTDVLKRRGIDALGAGRAIPKTIKISAADLSGAGYDVQEFYVGYNVKISSPPHQEAHGLAASYLVRRMDIHLFEPARNVLSAGETTTSFLEQNSQQSEEMKDVIIQDLTDKIENSGGIIVEDLKSYTDSAVQKSDEAIRSEVRKDYYTKGETETLVGTEMSSVTQTVNGFDFRFKEVEAQADKNSGGLKEIGSFIRLQGGKIVLGQENDETEFRISNKKAAFVDRGDETETAYISDGRFYAPRVSVDELLDMGGFRFDAVNGLVVRWIGG